MANGKHAFIAIVATALVLVSCGTPAGTGAGGVTPSAATSAGAGRAPLSGEVVVYSTHDPEVTEKLARAFNSVQPNVRVQFITVATGAALSERLRTEQDAGRASADVYQIAVLDDMVELNSKGRLMKYASPEFSRLDASLVGPDSRWFGYARSTLGIVYNTAKVKDPPTDWGQLTDPRWKNQVGIPDPTRTGPIFLNTWAMYKLYGIRWFQDAKNNGVKIFTNNAGVANAVASGELSIGVTLVYIANNSMVTGAPVKIIVPKTIPALTQYAAILANAPHPDGARAWIDFLASKTGQQAMVSAMSFYPVDPTASVGALPPLPADAAYITMDSDEAVKSQKNVLAQTTPLFR